MSKIAKAIAALVSAVVMTLVAFNVVPAALGETANPATIEMVVTAVVGIGTAAGVWAAPANG